MTAHWPASLGGNEVVFIAGAPPTATDDATTAGAREGNRWHDQTADDWYICSNATPGAAVWRKFSTTSGAGIGDAPSDGNAYGRLNAVWTPVLPIAGGVLAGTLTLSGSPTADLQAATKAYVDTTIASQNKLILVYSWANQTTAPPNSGTVRGNNATQSAVTTLWLSDTTNNNTDATYVLGQIRSGDVMMIQDKDDSTKVQEYKVTGAPTDSGTYFTIPVSWLKGGSALTTAGNILVALIGSANKVPEAPTDGQVYGRQGSTTAWLPTLPLTGGTLSGGLGFGSTLAGSVTDLSKHIALFSTNYGFNITSGSLNVVTSGVNVVTFSASTIFRAPIVIDGATTGYWRGTYYRTSGNNRWLLAANQAAETGSDTGSDFSLWRYGDTGTTVVALSVSRATGVVTFSAIPVSVTPATADSSTAVATTAFVKAQSYVTGGPYLPLTGGTLSGGLTVTGTSTLTGAATAPTPSAADNSTNIATTAWTRTYAPAAGSGNITTVGTITTGTWQATAVAVAFGGTGATTAPTALTNLGAAPLASPTFTGTPAAPTPAVGTNSTQIATTAFVLATPQNQFAPPTGAVNMGNQVINNVGAPVAATDAANKSYVDATVQGLQIKPTANLATSAALPANAYNNGAAGVGATLTGSANGPLAVDGQTVAVNQIVLVKNEAAAANNGLYTVTQVGVAGTSPYILTRHGDMNSANEFAGAFVPVGSGGAANSNTLWLANPTTPVTVGTTAIPFTQLNAATTITAGNGINISANVVSAVSANTNNISIGPTGINIGNGYAGQVSINTLGVITIGTWNGATIAPANGGTGATSLTGYITGNGTGAFTASPTIPNTSISGLGTMSTQNATAVAITGGTIDNVVFDGGTF
jgi:hypothetical protein